MMIFLLSAILLGLGVAMTGPIGIEVLLDKLARRLGLQEGPDTGQRHLGKICKVVLVRDDYLRIEYDGSTWFASKSDTNESMETGDLAIIESVEGSRFKVRKHTVVT